MINVWFVVVLYLKKSFFYQPIVQKIYGRLHLVFNDLPDDYFILDHFPLETWHKKTHGSYHLHGHVHSINSGLSFPSFILSRIRPHPSGWGYKR